MRPLLAFLMAAFFCLSSQAQTGLDKSITLEAQASVSKAVKFLISKQNEDGSWGEHFESCVQHCYIQHEDGQIINTGWALLGLMKAKYPNKEVIEKGVEFTAGNEFRNTY